MVKPSYLGSEEVQIPKNDFTEGDWEQAGTILASDSSFSTLSVENTSIDETNSKHIRKIICENRHFKEFKLSTVTITQPAFEVMCEALKQNSTLEQLSFLSVGLSLGQFQSLGKCLEVNRGVKQLRIHKDTFYPISADCIKDIFLKNPSINSLALSEVAFQASAFEKISELIKSAPNLTELEFVEVDLDEKKTQALLDALKYNKKLKKLTLTRTLKESGLLQLGDLFAVNTTIEDFMIVNKPGPGLDDETVARLVTGLKSNYTLKSLHCIVNTQKSYETLFELVHNKPQIKMLKFAALQITDHSPIVRLLRENRTLQELEYFTLADINAEPVANIFGSIKVNKGLRKLTFIADFPILHTFTSIFNALKVNDTLTHLTFESSMRYVTSPEVFWAHMLETMPHNKSLVSVTLGRSQAPQEIQEFFDRNKAEQLKHIRRVRSVIKVIVLRAEQFSMLLPLEIWAMILSAIELPGVTVDFGQMLVENINAQ